MKNILVPTDFSDASISAVEVASRLSEGIECCVHLITIIDDDEEKKEDVEKKLDELKSSTLARTHEVITHIYEDNNVSDIILKCAEEIQTDLIVIGSRGSSTVAEILLGSNTEKIVKQSDFTVLTIKSGFINNDIKSIAFASDFSASCNEVMETVEQFAKLFNAEVHFLKINTPSHFEPTRVSIEKINRFIELGDVKDRLENGYKIGLYSDSTEELGILNYSIENEIDMIALATHKANFWQIMFERTSQNIVNHSFKPVLTIPIKK